MSCESIRVRVWFLHEVDSLQIISKMIVMQETVHLFVTEEPRRLNNQPMEGGAGIHVLHNVTSTSKNVHRRRSPDVISLFVDWLCYWQMYDLCYYLDYLYYL